MFSEIDVICSVKSALRREMNKLIGMTKNDDVINVDLATADEVEDYANGTGDDPTLEPMRPYLGQILVEWNTTLCELFTEHLAETEGWELTKYVRDVLETAFENRLATLQKVLRRLSGKTTAEIDNMKRIDGKRQRASSRRDKVRFHSTNRAQG